MRRIAKKEGPTPCSNSSSSVAARFFWGVLSVVILATTVRPILNGHYRGKAGAGVIYRESEPLLFWIMIGATLLMAGMCGYLAFRYKEPLKK
jgi:hypothetical protein